MKIAREKLRNFAHQVSSSGSVRCYCVLGKTRLLLFLYPFFFLFNKFLIYIFVVFFLFCFTSYYSLEWREQLRVCFCLFVFYVFVKFTYSARYYSKLKQSGNRSPCSRPWESERKELKRTKKKTCAGNTLCLQFMCVCVCVWVCVSVSFKNLICVRLHSSA